MANLELNPQIRQEKREYSVQEIFRLAEKFRHLAKDLNQVFIEASRQKLIHKIETDPDEEELKEELGFVGALARRLKARRQRKEFKKLSLVKVNALKNELRKDVIKSVESKPFVEKRLETPQPFQVASGVAKEEPKQSIQVAATKINTDELVQKANPRPAPVVAGSLLDAARGFNSQIEGIAKPVSHQESKQEAVLNTSKKSVLHLSAEELPRYKKFADIAEQLLEARQLPDFKTLVEMSKKELSPLGVELLEEISKKHGF